MMGVYIPEGPCTGESCQKGFRTHLVTYYQMNEGDYINFKAICLKTKRPVYLDLSEK